MNYDFANPKYTCRKVKINQRISIDNNKSKINHKEKKKELRKLTNKNIKLKAFIKKKKTIHLFLKLTKEQKR